MMMMMISCDMRITHDNHHSDIYPQDITGGCDNYTRSHASSDDNNDANHYTLQRA